MLGVELAGGAITGVVTGRGTVRPSRLICAAVGSSWKLLGTLGLELPQQVLPQIPLDEIAARLAADTLAIVPVSPEIRYPGRPNQRQGGHLILLHGRDRDGVWIS